MMMTAIYYPGFPGFIDKLIGPVSTDCFFHVVPARGTSIYDDSLVGHVWLGRTVYPLSDVYWR